MTAVLQLQPLPPAGSRIVDDKGNMDPVFRLALQAALDQIVGAVNGVAEAQAAAATATAAAATAQTAAEDAQAAADTVAATVAALDIPPSDTRTITASGSVLASDATILVDATGGAVTVALLPAIDGTPVLIRKIDASANAVTIAATGGETVNGGPSVSMNTQYEQKTAASDGTNWYAG